MASYNTWPTPVLENEVLTARIHKMQKNGIWESGMFFLPKPIKSEGGSLFFPLLLVNAEQRSGMVISRAEGMAEMPETILRDFAESIVKADTCPEMIIAADNRTMSLLSDFCRRTGIGLARGDGLERFEEAKTAILTHASDETGRDKAGDSAEENMDDSDEHAADELDQFLSTLMQMRDEELRKMPGDLVRTIYDMAEWGMVPSELLIRINNLFE